MALKFYKKRTKFGIVPFGIVRGITTGPAGTPFHAYT